MLYSIVKRRSIVILFVVTYHKDLENDLMLFFFAVTYRSFILFIL